jgi:23S rRNA (cytosine1962-C5)-methyltransferase
VSDTDVRSLIAAAATARADVVDDDHVTAFRLFSGHLEGDPRFVVDVYAGTAVIVRHGPAPDDAGAEVDAVAEGLRIALPWLRSIVLKERDGADEARRGRVVWTAPGAGGVDTVIREHGVAYAIDLLMHQDASFYVDTRELRRWLLGACEGASVLNTFAYTGSLGVAAKAGGAARVIHTDLNARFLEVAKASYALNGFPVVPADFRARDFYSIVRGLKLEGARFDVVILDPPFFSTTRGGRVDLNESTARLVNKVRPLVRSGGKLVVVNNALFVSGAEMMRELDALCAGGWLAIDRLVEVPEDVRGFPTTRRGEHVRDPAPFTGSTKIAILEVRHKEG